MSEVDGDELEGHGLDGDGKDIGFPSSEAPFMLTDEKYR